MIATAAVTVAQVNLALCGGFSGAQRVAEIAGARGVALTVQCHGTAVLQAASLHCGAALRGAHSVEYHRFHDHLHGALPPAMRRVEAGSVRLGGEPGLGIVPLAAGPQQDGGTIRCHARIGVPGVELAK